MSKIYKKPSTVRLPKQKQELRRSEFVKAKKGIGVCKVCFNVYTKKQWRSADKKFDELKKGREEGVYMTICPACKMIKNGLYEGEIKVQNIPDKLFAELVHLAANFGERAKKRDPQDRIIGIEKRGKGLRITTTENQLAVKLAKKIHSVFRTERPKISYTPEPQEVVHIVVAFEK